MKYKIIYLTFDAQSSSIFDNHEFNLLDETFDHLDDAKSFIRRCRNKNAQDCKEDYDDLEVDNNENGNYFTQELISNGETIVFDEYKIIEVID